ncbi:hypothetical protein D3C77_553500 [compost metagenome]
MSIRRSISSTENSSIGFIIPIPALLIIKSSPPKFSVAASISLLNDSASRVSIWNVMALRPKLLISSAVSKALLILISATTTSAPACANLRAIAFPRPLAEPVTIATLPFMFMLIIEKRHLSFVASMI